jgi:hypothetical protein
MSSMPWCGVMCVSTNQDCSVPSDPCDDDHHHQFLAYLPRKTRLCLVEPGLWRAPVEASAAGGDGLAWVWWSPPPPMDDEDKRR